MRTTIDIPDPLFRKLKATAAQRGTSLKDLVTEALEEKLAPTKRAWRPGPVWMRGFGGLRRLRRETARVSRIIAREFEVIEPEDTQ